MPSKLGNALPLFIIIIIQGCHVGPLITSGLLHNFTQVKVKKVCLTNSTLHLTNIILLTQNCYCEVGVIIAIDQLLKLAVSTIQHLKSNQE